VSRIKELPSPALVISAIALTLAVGGGTFAIASSDNSQDVRIVKRVLSARAPGLTVAHAKSADSATTAEHASTADNATHADTADRIPPLSFTPITLINGWAAAGASFRTPEYAVDAQGIVHFEGAITQTTGTDPNPFDMPAALAPTTGHINLAVDQSGGATGRLLIGTNGAVTVFDDPDHAGAAGQFTALEGVTYVPGN
jgi:hypothetical protein